MRTRIHAISIPSEIGDFSDEVRRIFLELGRDFGSVALAGECVPPIDVYETDDTLEIAVDLPGVDPAAVRAFIWWSADTAASRAWSASRERVIRRRHGPGLTAANCASRCPRSAIGAAALFRLRSAHSLMANG
jgi:hypothetical protein